MFFQNLRYRQWPIQQNISQNQNHRHTMDHRFSLVLYRPLAIRKIIAHISVEPRQKRHQDITYCLRQKHQHHRRHFQRSNRQSSAFINQHYAKQENAQAVPVKQVLFPQIHRFYHFHYPPIHDNFRYCFFLFYNSICQSTELITSYSYFITVFLKSQKLTSQSATSSTLSPDLANSSPSVQLFLSLLQIFRTKLPTSSVHTSPSISHNPALSASSFLILFP